MFNICKLTKYKYICFQFDVACPKTDMTPIGELTKPSKTDKKLHFKKVHKTHCLIPGCLLLQILFMNINVD